MKNILFSFLCLSVFSASGQNNENPVPYYSYAKGLGMTARDSSFSMNIRFRIQNRIAVNTLGDKNLNTNDWEASVKRLRLRFDGFVYHPKISYVMQLSFSRYDIDFETLGIPSPVRDAMIFYKPDKHWTFGFGLAKLPGNRQRFASSGDLQFTERSPLVFAFNIDRDMGTYITYTNHVKNFYYTVKGVFGSGRGKNIGFAKGASYTSRVELYPLGQFSNGGDYFEGDLEREKTPKLSIGGSYNFNHNANRVGGTSGDFMYGVRDINLYFVDALLKYRGIAWSAEFAKREANRPITTSATGAVKYIYTGNGLSTELSYLFKNNFQVCTRYVHITPQGDIRSREQELEYYAMGVSRYIKGHRLKVQSDLTYKNVLYRANQNFWTWRFQVEIGI